MIPWYGTRMDGISVTFDREELARAQRIGPGATRAVGVALSKAGGDGLRAMRAAATKAVRFRKRIKASTVRDSMALVYPRSKSLESLLWRMNVRGVPIPLVDFPHSMTRRGVSVAINAGKRVLVKSAFEATMRSGHRGIFQRVKTGAKLAGRLPIKELFSTRVTDVFRDGGMVPAVQARAVAVMNAAYQRLLPRELAKVLKR